MKTSMNLKHIIITIILVLLMCGTASAWLSGYDHRVEIPVNNTGDVLTYWQYNFMMDTATEIAAGNMTYADGRDCRMTDVSDNLLPFWNETVFNISNTKIWVNGTSLDNVTNTTHYLYYGKTGASSVADINAMGCFGDSFEGSSLDVTVGDSFSTEFTKAVGNYSCHGSPAIGVNTTDEFWASWHYDPNSPDGTGGCNITKMVLFTNNNTNKSLEWITQTGKVKELAAPIMKMGDEYYSFFCYDRAAVSGGPWDIRYKNSSDGTTWSSIYELGIEVSTGRNVPRVMQINDTVWWITYNHKNATRSSVRYIEFNTTSKTFGSEIDIIGSTTSAWLYYPFGIYNSTTNEYHLYYWQAGSPHSIKVINRTGYGIWSSPSTITTMVSGYGSPWVIEWRSEVFLFYYDANYDIKVMNSTDGSTFSAFQTLHSHGSNYYWYPTVAAINNTHLAMAYSWHDPVGLGRIIYWDILKFTPGSSGRWEKNDSPGITVSNGVLTMTSSSTWAGISSIDYFGPYNVAVRSRAKYGTKGVIGFANDFPSMWSGTVDTANFFEFAGTTYTRTANEGANTDSTAVVSDTTSYHTDETTWISGQRKFYRDNYLNVTHTTNVPDETLGVGGSAYLNYPLYLDWIFVRKYAATEPTASVGSVEDSPSVADAPIINLHSASPETIYTNHTGAIQANYIVKSTNPLNLSTLAFLYGVNYTITGDMHSYIAIPPNSIAADGIYRAPNRNTTPYLSWEDNATITEGNVWQWGGGDNSSWWISKTAINATHTWINITGIAEHTFQSSFYLKKTSMYSAPKTAFEVNSQQGIIIKMWDNEIIRDRSLDYFMHMYFDTAWESTTPTLPIELWYCNSSFNPDTDDPTGTNCFKTCEWDGNRWVNHSWVPGSNASYAYPLILNASEHTITPDEINYIYLKSGTQSSKSYVLNATDYDPGICNITYAQTNTLWTYSELSGVSTQVAYTPSFFTTFVRDDEQFLHHMYIADDQGEWAHSDINNISIGVASYPVPPTSFTYFNVLALDGWRKALRMSATYNGGYMYVGMDCYADPDGGVVSHNLTLHYANETLVAVINDTFTTSCAESVEINFTTTPHHSTDHEYTLKCVSTDDEGSAATTWLGVNFILAAEGSQGWFMNEELRFWGMNNVPTLYTVISNNSLISYNAETDIYTMHVPFFKSFWNETFRFNETVHLESLNTEDVAYFKFYGHTIFDNANVHGWNTTTGAAAPITDSYRGYLISHSSGYGNITNSNLSYLGSDIYQQEGLNFIENAMDYLIYNTTLSHNSRGIIIEDCENYNISHCTITDNAEAGVGIYYSENIIVENCTVTDSTYDPGIYLYESNNNIIRDNIIQDCVYYGIRLRTNCDNNTLTGNNISGSGIYDYYFTAASTNNTIRDPASDTDKIRVTSTSEVNIENTDNAVFEEDSSNTTYAYPTNFSMSVTGLSHTFDITQRNMTITPETDNVRIRDLNWEGINVTFNASTDTAGNQVWFNITKPTWSGRDVSVYRNGITFYEGIADTSGTFEYNYSGGWSEWYFTFAGTPEVEPVTNLHPTTRIYNKIVWGWVNPDDYDTIMVYLDNTWMQNTTGTSYSASGLAQTTSYTIKLITVHEGTESVPVTDTQVTTAEQGGGGGTDGTPAPSPTPTPTPTATPEPTVTPTPVENVTENATIVIEPIPEITEEITSDYTATGSVWHLSFDKHLVFIPEHRNIIACDAMLPYACRYYEYQERFEIVIDGESSEPVFAEDQWVTFITRDGKKINQRIQTKVYNPLFYFTMPAISGSVGDISRYFVHGDEYVVDGVRFWWIGMIGIGLIIRRWKKQ